MIHTHLETWVTELTEAEPDLEHTEVIYADSQAETRIVSQVSQLDANVEWFIERKIEELDFYGDAEVTRTYEEGRPVFTISLAEETEDESEDESEEEDEPSLEEIFDEA